MPLETFLFDSLCGATQLGSTQTESLYPNEIVKAVPTKHLSLWLKKNEV